MTYPLVMKMRTEAIGAGGGDGSYFIWLVAWYQKALFQLKISPFFAPSLNYPQGWKPGDHRYHPAMVALALPGSLPHQPQPLAITFAIAASALSFRAGHVFVGETPDG